ncbi:hypothetical protein FJTKL_11871 [Diaporthe vaccinii]|uniref:Uncharacterized protein n=1 Tax=Diaporthe vaccinii TaxID=105482 RepID=A0ABR4FAB6_9PEZI
MFSDDDFCYPKPVLVSSGCCPFPSLVLHLNVQRIRKSLVCKRGTSGSRVLRLYYMYVCCAKGRHAPAPGISDRDALSRKKPGPL